MKKISPDAWRSMPWKNGAGTTIEIVVFPAGAQIDDFEWRVSRAAVLQDGSFSRFAGVDRSLALLQGHGMRLTADGVVTEIDGQNNIAVFAGDAATHAELTAGSITDFNVMSRRSVCAHRLTHWIGAASRALPEAAALLYCAAGSGTLVNSQGEIELCQDVSVQFDAADQLAADTLHSSPDSRFYCVQIYR